MELQRSEVGLHAAKKTRDEAYAAHLASRSAKDQLERTIVAMAKAFLVVAGVKVFDRKVTKKKTEKKEEELPVPAPTPMPMAA